MYLCMNMCVNPQLEWGHQWFVVDNQGLGPTSYRCPWDRQSWYDRIFRGKPVSSVCMYALINIDVPSVYLNHKSVSVVNTYSYLGIWVTNDFTDNEDIERLTRQTYASGNALISKFKKCTEEVKITLLQSFCSNFYCCELWYNFYKYSFNKARKAYNKIFSKFCFTSKPLRWLVKWYQ